MKVIIEDDEGRKTVVPFSRDEITIGREQGNTIRLPERNVSRHHARLTRNNGAVLVEDLDSSNGVRVNGEKIDGPTRIKEGDLVEIGDYDLGIEGKLESVASPVVGAPAGPLPAKFTAGPTRGDPADTAIIRMSDVKSFDPRVEARELQRLEMPRLVGLAGPVRGKDLYLTGTDVTLGRTDDNDIVVDHPSISRSHARFVLDGARWKAIDTRSANGVRINGEQYAVAGLEPGDIVELGHLKFRFCAPGEKFVPAADASEGQGNALGIT